MKYRKVSRGRRMSTWKGNRNGSGNSKFKTRHRKMRGGATGATVVVGGIKLYDCGDPDSDVGGHEYNVPGYNMHASEETNPSPNTPSIKEHNGTTVNTVFTGNTMKMGLFNRRSIFTSGPKHLHSLGLIQVITDNESCNISAQCSPIFYKNDTGVIHSKTEYVFFGQLDAKGTKNGWGICYDVSTSEAGRIFIGYWKDGTMNGLGIEVDFKYDTANNKHEPVGIYYGHFYQGKRHSFGIYYDITMDPNGKETLFHTQHKPGGNMCTLLDKSFEEMPEKEKNRHKRNFTSMWTSSLSLNSIPQDIGEYTEFFFKNLNLAIGITTSLVKREHGEKEYHIFESYVAIYQKFVDFCKSKLDDALEQYRSKKDKDTIEAGEKKLEKEKSKKFLQDLKSKGYITGEILDPEEEAAKKEMITRCTTSLTELDYVIQTPEEKIAKEEEEKKKKLDEHEKLTQANSDLETLKKEIEIMSQSSKFLKTINPNISVSRGRRSPKSRFSSHRSYRSSRSSDNSDNSGSHKLLLQTYATPRTPGRTATPAGTALETPVETLVESPGGGGNLMRKNTRTNKRMNKRKKTRKFRKSRRGGRR